MDLNSKKYRYTLERDLKNGKKKTCLFVMLNPSTADEKDDDATTHKCANITKKNGCGFFRVVNLFAWRATNPADLNLVNNPVGRGNDKTILEEVKKRKAKKEKIIVAWGDGRGEVEKLEERSAEVLKLFKKENIKVCYLKITARENPCHPLNPNYQLPFELKSFPLSNF